MKNIGYKEIEKMDWFEAYETLSQEARLPYSVHIPINNAFSKGLTFCDCAMNAYYLPSPSLNSSSEPDNAVCKLMRLNMLCFGFGEIPFVPDFRQVELSHIKGGLPIIRAKFMAWGQLYTADYCMTLDDVLHVRFTVRNEYKMAFKNTVWIHPQKPLDSEVFRYHYVSFNWNADCWKKDTNFRMLGNRFYTSNGLAGSVTPGRFESEWIENREIPKDNSNQFFCCSQQYFAFPENVLESVNNTLKLSIELQPEEEASFEIAIRLDDNATTEESLAVPYVEAEASAISYWTSLLAGLPTIDLGDETENAVVETARVCNLQLLIDDGDSLRPCQGGSSERFFVWVWEAMCSLLPMIQLGHFKPVELALRFIFNLQDGGCPPIGNFTSVKGAIGTSGPKWANTTGAALLLASKYIQLSNDKAFADEFLPKMIAAAHWITGELHETRKPGTPNRGIFPECRANDGDVGQVICTDCWLLSGLKEFAQLLTVLKHPAAQEMTDEAAQYKHDLDAVLDAHAHEDGFIPRSYDNSNKISFAFKFTSTPIECCTAHVSSANETRMRRFLDWMETNAFVGFFCSKINHHTYYIGNNELSIMKMYMAQNRQKCAWAASRVFRRFVVTPDVYMTQERYSTADCGFTCWQPNASNNGRLLEMQLDRFFYEAVDGTLVIFGAFSPNELKRNPSIKGVLTTYGKTDVFCKDGKICITTEKPLPAGKEIIICGIKMTINADTTTLSMDL